LTEEDRVDSQERRLQEAELARLNRVKQVSRKPADALGPELLTFFKQSVEKRHAKFGKIADAWTTLVPVTLVEHCALESFARGTLAVVVDSSSHLYELKQLLLAGLERQLLLACGSAGLKKVALKRGSWYDDGPAAGGGPRRRGNDDVPDGGDARKIRF
jgi:hypothetical protein